MITGDPVASPARTALPTKVGHFRWFICGLLFYATTVNYMDRVVMGILKTPSPKTFIGTTPITAPSPPSFNLATRLMLPIAGRLIDWLGIRLGYTLAVLVWGLSSIAHAFAGNILSSASLVLAWA